MLVVCDCENKNINLKMFNTELFIVELRKRRCLWYVRDSSHSDRELKLQAWVEIAKLLNESCHSYSLTNENITVDELQRKWKHLRDYYTREKKRARHNDTESNNTEKRGNSSGRKKRKSPLLDMLQFLDENQGYKVVEMTVEEITGEQNFSQESKEEEDESNEYTQLLPRKIKKIEEQRFHFNDVNADTEDSSEKQFLTSLTPIINNRNAKEKLNFQSRLMNSTPLEESPSSCIDEGEKTMSAEIDKRNTINKSQQTEDLNKHTTNNEATPKRDEYSIYGEYVANKLRNITNAQARHTAEFHINGILYKAEMGEYDTVSRDIQQNKTKVASPRTFNTRIDSLRQGEQDSEEGDIITTVFKTEIIELN